MVMQAAVGGRIRTRGRRRVPKPPTRIRAGRDTHVSVMQLGMGLASRCGLPFILTTGYGIQIRGFGV
jgi:hypothetical protein